MVRPERQLKIWRRHRACWDKVVDLEAVPGERLQIPCEGTTLPGYFFPGQQAALFLQGMPFRHGWEAVLTPVVDAMVARPTSTPDGSP